jgi:sugar lactone lactonase YvrE
MTTALHIAFNQPSILGESPTWSRAEQVLYWVDIKGKAVHRLDPASGAHRFWSMTSEPGCLALRHGGLVVACRDGIHTLDTKTGAMQLVVAPDFDTTVLRYNDGKVDAAGRFWLGTMNDDRASLASMYCLERGKLTRQWDGITTSNGLSFSPDMRLMYHADTPTHTVTVRDFDVQTGTPGAPRTWLNFSADRSTNYGGRPDGAATDAEGAYWVAMWEGGRVLRFGSDGRLLQEIAVPARYTTMPAFGGPDLKTLYITTAVGDDQSPGAGRIFSCPVDVPGLPAEFYKD